MSSNGQLRVLQICHDYEGPFQHICHQYNQAFPQEDVTTVYLRGERDSDVVHRTGGNHVLFLEESPLRGIKLSGILGLARLFRECDFDIVIAHRYKPIYLAGIMSYFFNVRSILGVAHEHDVFRRPTRALFVTFWRRNIFVVAVSGSVERNIAIHCPSLVTDNRLTTLGHALDSADVPMGRESARMHLDLPDSAFLFGSVGRLVGKKKHELLIRAFARAQLGEPCFLVLIGSGPLENSLRELVGSLDVEARVLFVGHVDHASRYFRAFDAFVFPSGDQEAFGLVLLEAMSAGLPILASDAPGPDEVLGSAGIRFVSGDMEELADKLCWLRARDADQRRALGREAKQRFDSEYTMAGFTRRLRSLPPLQWLSHA